MGHLVTVTEDEEDGSLVHTVGMIKVREWVQCSVETLATLERNL